MKKEKTPAKYVIIKMVRSSWNISACLQLFTRFEHSYAGIKMTINCRYIFYYHVNVFERSFQTTVRYTVDSMLSWRCMYIRYVHSRVKNFLTFHHMPCIGDLQCCKLFFRDFNVVVFFCPQQNCATGFHAYKLQ